MNSFMKKLAIVVLGCSLLGNTSTYSISPREVIVNATRITFTIAGLTSLYNAAKSLLQKDETDKQNSRDNAGKAAFVSLIARILGNIAIKPLTEQEKMMQSFGIKS